MIGAIGKVPVLPSLPHRFATTSTLHWVDALKGFAILLVVFGHSLRGSSAAGLFESGGAGVFQALDARIYAFHMPLFFMISGFFLMQSLLRASPADFVQSRIKRLVWPLILWSYIFIASKLVAGSLANTPLVFDWRLLFPFPGQEQFWFLWALFVLHMGLLVLRPALISARWRMVTLWGLLVASLSVLLLPTPVSLYYWTNRALEYLPYLVIGMLLAQFGLTRLGDARFGAFGAVLAVGLIGFAPILTSTSLSIAIVGSVICLCLIATFAWIVPQISHRLSWLVFCGQASMMIYLAHTLFTAPLRVVLLQFDVTSPVLHVVLGTGIGVLGPLALRAVILHLRRPAIFGISGPKPAF